VVDHVIGKHLYIDYAVALDPHRARDACRDPANTASLTAAKCASPAGLRNSSGKSSSSPLKVGSDIRNIPATLSSLHVTEGVRRILATYGSRTR